MRFKQIMEMSTVAGGIAPVSAPLGATQTRENASVKGLKPVTQLKSKSKNKGPYANSVNEGEGKVKDLSMDLKSPPNGLSEADLIVVPGQGKRLKPGFIPRAADRTDREVEMAKGDLFQAAKNAKAVFDMVKDISEDDGLEGWVQEKIVKAADYLNTLREYFESKQVQETALPSNAIEDMDEAKRPERQAPSTSLQVGNRVVADLRKEKNYPGTSQYRSGIVSRVGEKGVHIKPDDGGEAEWHPYKIVKKLGVAEGSGPKEKQKTPYRDINSPEYRDAADKQKQRMANDKAAEPGKKLLAKKGVAEASLNEGRLSKKDAVIMAYLHTIGSVDSNPTGTPDNELIENWQEVLEEEFGIEMDADVLANLMPQLDSQVEMLMKKYTKTMNNLGMYESDQGVAEGAKVDRMVQHVKQSEKKLGHSDKEAENIAWATANKRGMLDNKNKKK